MENIASRSTLKKANALWKHPTCMSKSHFLTELEKELGSDGFYDDLMERDPRDKLMLASSPFEDLPTRFQLALLHAWSLHQWGLNAGRDLIVREMWNKHCNVGGPSSSATAAKRRRASNRASRPEQPEVIEVITPFLLGPEPSVRPPDPESDPELIKALGELQEWLRSTANEACRRIEVVRGGLRRRQTHTIELEDDIPDNKRTCTRGPSK